MKHAFTKEAKIGLVTLVSLILLYIGINYLKGINLFKPVNHYFITFSDVRDLTVSSPIYVDGYKVGLVRSINYDYSTVDKIVVEVSLDKEMRVNKDSYVTISKSLLGGADLYLHLNKYTSEFIKSGSYIEGRIEGDMMSSLQENLLPGVVDLLPKIDSILAGLQAIVNHPALSQSLTQIERTTNNLELSTKQLNSLLNKDVPLIVGNLKTISDNFVSVSEEFNGLDYRGLFAEIDQTLSNLKETTEKLNSKENSIGLLLNDRSLYDNLNQTSANAASLLQDLQENPKRYVHFSLF
ncbi:phospholipid/cholesterol/gamma-HCH transport system substrate-binding protein [Parabacteroides sp. PFB2-12]|uniref:MlaD family protein n=1 Tax=unclassified Parabacteroides TaxID=2649774 RepID=UPI002473036C|nr:MULTISPECIES: MlaD family protein [unclassified Parabacteroides]MDH6342308.1 phospholipid/cholesterol/gamma-HCH transport system substrate-binding protein [Parabacteroides sp. PM6-13]MDH6390651.1 phospholipid/cholesterol/gamma-HCH transport system substrate-binding protein [Parabacteroides sp. PFB2-12]